MPVARSVPVPAEIVGDGFVLAGKRAQLVGSDGVSVDRDVARVEALKMLL